ncbi:DUF4247 domain-containing protein [Paenibacillus mesophilus]|uniref:DUF4247 domain-containing protein n=1 Tax=Paenibacillus mesophilus TaxID=2582849 RepID=UPI00110D41B4|nr:DUF4247 domain-containing protein [Paenibacillus mesophilus]TMV47759.1 DUF4247 domain-containing protein [Paenibacillus mesophilus]
MKRWYRWTTWVTMLLVVALLSGCANAANYVKDTYPLVDMAGKGKSAAKVYEAEGKTVPEVAKELSDQDKPAEMSKEDPDQMFLLYDNRVVNLQKSPDNPSNTLIEIDTIEYAKQNYDSSFLEGYIAASLIQSIFGNSWYDSSYKKYSTPYKGYSTSVPAKSTTSSSSASSNDDKKPTTSDRTGSFTSKGSTPAGSSTPATGSSGSSSSSAAKGSTGSSSTGSSGSSSSSSSSSSKSSSSSTGSWSSTSSGSVRKNDGSSPSTKSTSKPTTSNRTGSFSSKSSVGKKR